MARDKKSALIEQLSRSQIYRDYERAFSETTGLPLGLRPVEAWQITQQGKKHQNPFCSIMSENSPSCAACLQVQQELAENPTTEPKSVRCFAGLCDTSVPVRVGEELIGFLQTGQVLLKKPTRAQFARTARLLMDWGVRVDLKKLEESYFHTRVLKPAQYESMIRLLSIFAQHLSSVCNLIAVQERNAEPPVVTRAREFIHQHQSDALSLGAVAQSVNTSTFYFCKLFKKATGLNFTEYVSRVRIEKAKNLLLNPNARVSEIAYAVGFQSLTHFNRVFRKFEGQSPTTYRERLPHSVAPIRSTR